MRKITIMEMNLAQSRQSKRNRLNRNSQRKYGIELQCSKSGIKLHVGDTAYRTVRKYLCESCGSNSEIG